MHVTDGVHGEIRTVRFQRWKQRPNLLEQVKPLLTTHSVDDGQIRGLATKIGERASPQDVDLSLMGLSSSLQREGHDVLLVTDDFKMAKATEEHQLAGEVCPPSTFFERIAKSATVSSSETRIVFNSPTTVAFFSTSKISKEYANSLKHKDNNKVILTNF